jgi:hypothetical protein
VVTDWLAPEMSALAKDPLLSKIAISTADSIIASACEIRDRT